MIGQEMTYYCKWRLTISLFDFIADGGLDIIAFGIETSAKRVEVSCAASVAFKDIMNRLGNN